jgi:hypothetical protein
MAGDTQDTIVADDSADEIQKVDVSAEDQKVVDSASDSTNTDGADEDPKQQTDEQKQNAKQRKNRFQDRIREVVRERQQAQGENAQLRKRLEELEAKVSVNQAPSRDQFQSDAEFVKSLTEFTIQQALPKALDAQKQQQQQTQVATDYDVRLAKVQQVHADYQDVVSGIDDIIFQPEILDTIKTSELGPEIAYHLGKNPDEAAFIASLPATRALVELGKLESKLIPVKPAIKASKAPDPIKPVAGASGKVTLDLNSKDVPIDEFMRRRREAEIAKNKRR